MIKARLSAVLLLLAPAAAARAQAPAASPPPRADIEATVLETLVVRGRLPGPAWWRVSDQDTVVYVLGLPDALPSGMDWDRTILERRLAGADRLITPPELQVGVSLFGLPKLLWDARGVMRPAEAEAAQPADPRLAEAAPKAGRSAADYRRLRPWFAGLMLTRDYRRRVGLDYREPLRVVSAAARRAKAPVQPAFAEESKASTLLADAKAIPPDAGRACMEAALDEVEAGDGAIRAAAEAWAHGDVRVALSARRATDVCYAALPGAAALKRDALQREVEAIEAALAKPGHAVAALPLRSILAKDGVLDRLRAKGYTVQTPE